MRDILQEEIERLQQLIASYDVQIQALPKGSISWKQRGRRRYAYRAYREVNTVRFEYLGKSESEKTEAFSMEMERRRELEGKRKAALRRLRQAERMLRAADNDV